VKKTRSIIFNTLALLLSTLFVSCDIQTSKYPQEVKNALDLAGENKTALKEVIRHYSQNPADSLKLKAAFFLIGNMPGLYTLDTTTGKAIIDIENISSEYLIKNIEQAYNMCEKQLLTRELSFNNFCNYVLPYRINTEKPENWRSLVIKKYSAFYDSLKSGSIDNLQLVNLINDDLKKGFKFSLKRNSMPHGYSSLSMYKTGNCHAMTKLATFCMRAFGIPVAMDYTPSWGNINGGGHVWNALIINDSTSIPFMGAEGDPYKHKVFRSIYGDLAKKCGKVFRQTFSLPGIEKLEYKEILNRQRKVDVTGEYWPVENIPVNMPKKLGSQQYAVICSYSNGWWKPIFKAKNNTRKSVTFENMSTGLIYMVGIDYAGEITPIIPPFILSEEKKVIELVPDMKHLQSIKIRHTTPLIIDIVNSYTLGLEGEELWSYQDNLAKGKHRQEVVQGKGYTLYYWDNDGWQLLSKKMATKEFVEFKNMPTNCLFKITGEKSNGKERIFTYKNGELTWW
jgi:hypothetical protein